MIDPTKPVRLKQLAVISSNIYHPREYQPGELPDVLLNDSWVIQDAPPTPLQPLTTSARTIQQLEISTRSETVSPKAYPTPPPVVVSGTAPTVGEKVNVNTSVNDALAGLPNIGPQTATNILKQREKGLFKDLKDLGDRVPLSRGKWDDIADKLVF